MKKIVNLTQHVLTDGQLEDISTRNLSIVEVDKEEVGKNLNFDHIPNLQDILAREAGASFAIIGGAPYLMGPLEEELRRVKITPLYAFSTRRLVEEMLPDGSVKKMSLFFHLGFIEV